MRLPRSLCFAVAFTAGVATAGGEPVKVVAAENVYGDIAWQIGGSRVDVVSLITQPAQDPHLFEATAGAARQVADARIVVFNGAGYDAWMEGLLAPAPRGGRAVIVVAALLGRKAGDNPHLWYDPAAGPAVARALAAQLAQFDPEHAGEYRARLQAFEASMGALDAKMAAMRRQYAGIPVAATEPVYGYVAAALGLVMHEERFQLAVMNGVEPAARDLGAFESDLRRRRVRALLYNSQVKAALVSRLVAIAGESRVPVVGVTEMEPPGLSYGPWLLGQLEALGRALDGASP